MKKIKAIQRTNGDWVELAKGQRFQMNTNKKDVTLFEKVSHGEVIVQTFRFPLQVRFA